MMKKMSLPATKTPHLSIIDQVNLKSKSKSMDEAVEEDVRLTVT
jgi:hypothetical protein